MGTGIVREISTRYVLLIKVVSSFFLMVKTFILLGLDLFALDSGLNSPTFCFSFCSADGRGF